MRKIVMVVLLACVVGCEGAPVKVVASREVTATHVQAGRERCRYAGFCGKGFEWGWFCRGTQQVETTTKTTKTTFTDGTVEFGQTISKKPLEECM